MTSIIQTEGDPLINSSNEGDFESVCFLHPAYEKMLDTWTMIKDCLEGAEAIKKKRTVYLPQPNASDQSRENQQRYEDYLTRAMFYEATARTLGGLVGQVFAIDPVIELPPSLEPLLNDIDGEGVSMESSLEQAAAAVVAYGRGGVFVDYPQTSGVVTVKDRDEGLVRPTIMFYSPFSIINWRYKKVGAVMKKSLIVLAENRLEDGDGFEVRSVQQWRVLKLDEQNEYVVEVYRRKTKADDGSEGKIERVEGPYKPTDASGKPFNTIPFEFIGSLNNNQHPDNPPLRGIAELNIGHYRNSADYEEACFIVGQPTVWASGLDKNWIKEVFKDEEVHFGSRSVILLPLNAEVGLIQAQPNTLPFEAMKLKERQMTALGAKLVEPAQVQRTLGEARLEEATTSSILVTAVKNVQKAYTKALEYAKQFHGETGEVKLVISTDFAISRLDPNERVALLNEWVTGGITTKEYRSQLRKAGIAEDADDHPEIKKPEAPKPTPSNPEVNNETQA